MSLPDFTAFYLTLQLAAVTTVLLLIFGTPLAWWLARTKTRAKPVIEALVAMPLVLPPTVLGFYLLIFLSPETSIGKLWITMTGDTLTFSFAGLVIGSMIYSLPFMIQPLQSAFETRTRQPLEVAASLNARPLDAFFTVALPTASRGFLTASTLTFAHTLGEFGVVLMIGGSIPGETKVVSIEIYERVAAVDYVGAHILSLILLLTSFIILLLVYSFNRRARLHVPG